MNQRTIAAAAALLVLAAACGGGKPVASQTPSLPSPRTPTSSPGPPTPSAGSESAAQALAKLCPAPQKTPPPSGKPEPTPPDIKQVEGWVSQVRGLPFEHQIATTAVTPDQMKQDLAGLLNDPAQNRYLDAQGKALAVMGAIPTGTDLAAAVRDFLTAQVAGYYDPDTKRLVFLGKKHLSPLDRFILAHELTHALDDQHFDLSRFDSLANHCQDEADAAATAMTEGDAMVASSQVVLRYFSAAAKQQVVQQGTVAAEHAQVPASVPPFVTQLEEWPYIAGLKFVQYLQSRGGEAAVNAALQHPPASTEQVIHPSLYPSDVPQTLDIPDVGLGSGWHDLAVGQVGEEWLSIYLGLRLDSGAAQDAAAGWGGGLYRAWTDGSHVAAILATVWDTPEDAAQFASAMRDFLGKSDLSGDVQQTGQSVRVLFGSDAGTLQALKTATGS